MCISLPFIREILSLSAEDGNENDPYAVTMMKLLLLATD